MALYALNYEIARTAEAVSNEALGDIRLAWWAQGIDEIYAGGAVRAHPALQAYGEAVAEFSLPREPMDALIEARGKDLDAAPFEAWQDLDAYVDATAGSLFRLAIEMAAESPERPKQFEGFLRYAGRAWGYCGLLRALPHWSARRRTFFPAKLLAHNNLTADTLFEDLTGHGARSCHAAVLDRGRHAYKEARDLATLLPSSVFPAVGYLALAPRYFRALSQPHTDVVMAPVLTPLLLRQFSLIMASATGKV